LGGQCPHCGADPVEFDVFVQQDRLAEVRPVGRERNWRSEEGFQVLEE
jgi:hypothetical protein